MKYPLLLENEAALKPQQQTHEKADEERSSSPFCASHPSSIPLSCLLEDLAQFAMKMEDVLDDIDRGCDALSGLQCWEPVIRNVVPEQHALLQRVAQAKQAIPQLREVVRQQVCGPLRQDLLLVAHYLGNPSWRLLETPQDETSEERCNPR
ncbi:hypothetical protein [Ktedonospora formicarum]|uniref:hypothetical protein n=1 Tax=Ktedonospora formicarum TaxID=2778364 RepID=UPI001C691EAF|nr:hypothetical protein [Ktedonospora formicarum]